MTPRIRRRNKILWHRVALLTFFLKFLLHIYTYNNIQAHTRVYVFKRLFSATKFQKRARAPSCAPAHLYKPYFRNPWERLNECGFDSAGKPYASCCCCSSLSEIASSGWIHYFFYFFLFFKYDRYSILAPILWHWCEISLRIVARFAIKFYIYISQVTRVTDINSTK